MNSTARLEAARLVFAAQAARNTPDNDNAGEAWHRADVEPHTDDYRYEATAATRNARALAPEVAAALSGVWYADKHYARAQVRFRTFEVASNASRRRERLLQHLLPLAGFPSW